jgi:hypothetical protein
MGGEFSVVIGGEVSVVMGGEVSVVTFVQGKQNRKAMWKKQRLKGELY